MKVNPFTAFATNIVTLAIITLTLTTPSCCNIINVHYTLQEEQTAGSYIGNIVNDANLSSIFDQTSIRQLSFAFMGSSHFIDNFNLDPITGVMETGSKKLDRESMCEGMETCHISLDVGIKPPTFFRLIRIDINLLDINDHSPTFPSPLQVIEVSESAPVGSFYQLLLAQDPDSPTNSVANYRLSPFTPGSHDNFILDWEKAPTNPDLPASKQPPTPRLMLLRQLDREKQNLYYAELTAYDGANPPKVGKLRVEVRVMDANDNSPIFNPPSYQVTVKEDISVGSSIATVHAIDADEGLNGMVNYHFSPATNTAHGTIFHVNNRTGEITSISELDYEKKQSYQLVVEVMDSGADPVVVSTLVTVIVLDVNDNPPFITSQSMTSHDHYDAVLLEDTPAKTFVAHLTVADKDSGSGGAITCSLRGHSSPTSANLLSIDQMLTSAVSVFNLVRVSESEYQIETTMELNREVKEAYEFQVFCHDDGKPRLNSTKVVNVKVDDVNDCTPTFSTKMHTLDLYENNYPGVDVMRISADDCDVGENGRMTYSLLNQRDSFKIDRSTGLLTAEVSFDREVVGNKLSVKVVVKDNGNPQKSSNTKMVINILDINDNSPIFEKVAYQFNVTENLSAKTYVGSLKATDADKASSENSRVYYSILPGPSSNHFSISNLTGDLFTATKLDREMEVLHYLVVVAKDNGIPSLSSSTRVVVVVEDTNDNPPLFEVPNHNNLTIQLCSRAPHNYRVARFSAYDFDSEDNGRVVYGMDNDTLFMNGLGEIFHLHHTTGHLTLLSEDISGLDGRLLKLKIWAKDLARPPEVSLRSEAEVLVSINQSAPILINGKYIESGDWLLTLGYYDNYTNNKSGFVYFVLLSAFLFIVISVLLILFCVFCVIKIRRYTKSNTSCVRISNCDNYNCRTEAMKKMTTLPLSSTVNTELMMAVDGIEEGDEDDSHLVVEEIIDGNCSFIGGLNCKNISQLSDTSALHLNSKARTLDVSIFFHKFYFLFRGFYLFRIFIYL